MMNAAQARRAEPSGPEPLGATGPRPLEAAPEAWSACLTELGLRAESLLWQSPYDPKRRIYAHEDSVYKVQLSSRESSARSRAQDLAGEFELLERCRDLPGVPAVLEHQRSEAHEVLVLRRLEGETLDQIEVSWPRLLVILASVAGTLIALARRGVSHNDVRAENVLVDADSVTLLDFDQATRASTIQALLRSFTGFEIGEGVVHRGLPSLVKSEIHRRLSPRVIRVLKRLLGRKDDVDGHALPTLPGAADAASSCLLAAWKLAQESAASSPGCRQAYHSFRHRGIDFPGERPWLARWRQLDDAVDWSGRRVLELGCNMALLSSFALQEAGAAAALAVDADEQILGAAALTASALAVSPSFAQVDFDDAGDWESRLSRFEPDLVFALNVLNWVRDKDRFMAFLARFDDVVFEGHESMAVAEARFRAVGFRRIELLGLSERGRPLLRCRKAPA
jgi:hypothetical protein